MHPQVLLLLLWISFSAGSPISNVASRAPVSKSSLLVGREFLSVFMGSPAALRQRTNTSSPPDINIPETTMPLPSSTTYRATTTENSQVLPTIIIPKEDIIDESFRDETGSIKVISVRVSSSVAQVGSVQLSHSNESTTEQQNENTTHLTTETTTDLSKNDSSEFNVSNDPEIDNDNFDDDESNLPASPDTVDSSQATAVQRSHFSVDESDRILHHISSVKLYKTLENNYDHLSPERYIEYNKKNGDISSINIENNEKTEKEKNTDNNKKSSNEFLNSNINDFFRVESSERISNRPLGPRAYSNSYHDGIVTSSISSMKPQKKWSPNQNSYAHKFDESNVGVLRPILSEYAYPATYESINAATTSRTKHIPSYGMPEINYEIDEAVSVSTQGRIHGVQTPNHENGKQGYVQEDRKYRRYRVEERTSDGFIVGEYGIVSHDDGSLRGVRYTADGAASPRLIYDTLVKFLSL